VTHGGELWSSITTCFFSLEDPRSDHTSRRKLIDIINIAINAMGCHKGIVQLIVREGGEYVLALKEKQGRLYQEVKELFEDGDW
jgi:hypothetical protein